MADRNSTNAASSQQLTTYAIYRKKMEVIRRKHEAKWLNPPIAQVKKPKKPKNRRKHLPKRPPPLKQRPDYHEYLESRTWRLVRRWKLALVGYCCEKCQSRGRLQIHHLTYERLGREKASDLQVLCAKCHQGTHQIDLDAKRHLRSIQQEY